MVGFGKRLGNGADKLTVSRGKSLLDESGKAADEVDPGFARRLLERFCEHHRIAVCGSREHRNRSDRYSLVYYRDTVCFFDLLADGNEPAAKTHDFVVDFGACAVNVRIRTVEQ